MTELLKGFISDEGIAIDSVHGRQGTPAKDREIL